MSASPAATTGDITPPVLAPAWHLLCLLKSKASMPARGRASAARVPVWWYRVRRGTRALDLVWFTAKETVSSVPDPAMQAPPATRVNTQVPGPASTAVTAAASPTATAPAASAWATTRGTPAPGRALRANIPSLPARDPVTLTLGTGPWSTKIWRESCTQRRWRVLAPASAARTGAQDRGQAQTAWSAPGRASPVTAPEVPAAPGGL